MLRNPGLRKSVEQPVLDLNFAASQIGANAAPDSRIDFSRGSNAWFVDSDGLLKKSPHNLAAQSEDLGNGWAFFNASASLNTAISPTGELTADKVVTNNSATLSTATKQVTTDDSVDVAVSVYVKAAGQTVVNIQFYNKANTFHGSGDYDLITGTRTSNPSAGTESSIENVGNDWYRITFTGLNTATGGTTPSFRVVCNQTGDGSKGFLVWGAQLSQHSTLPVGNPYIRTDSTAVYAARLDHDPTWFMSAAQEQNLLQYSETIDNSYWDKTRSTVTANAIAAPDGTVTAELLSEDTNSGTHIVRQNTPADVPQTAGKSYVFSGYLKSGSRTQARLKFEGSAHQASIDLTAGTITNDGFDSVSISDEGNGWFRFAAVETADVTNDPLIQIALLNDSGQSTYSGDGSSGLYVWGLQLEVGTSPGTYHRTEGAPYYGEGATPRGLLIEEARTNLVTDSESHTYLDGDINVTQSGSAGLAPDGTNTAIAFMETAATGDHVSRKAVTIADNQNIIFSFFAKANGRTSGQIEFFDAGGAFAFFDLALGTINSATVYSSATNGSSSIEDYGNGWFRVSLGLTTVSGDTSGTVQVRVTNAASQNSYAGDATKGLFIWGMQLEQGSFPTSYIKTTGSTATRNADVATMGPTTGNTELVTNGTFDTDSDWTNNGGGTIAISSGKLTFASTAQFKNANQSLVPKLVAGRRYRASFDVTSYTSGSLKLQYREGSGDTLIAQTTGTSAVVSSKSFDFTCSDAAVNKLSILTIGTAGTNTYEVDNVSVRELYPFEQYNPAEGTVVCDFQTLSGLTRGPFHFHVHALGARGLAVRVKSDAGTALDVITRDASNFNNINISSLDLRSFTRVVAAYNSSGHARAGAGGATGTTSGNTVQLAVDQLDIGTQTAGGSNTGTMSGHIRRLQYSTRFVSELEAQNLTSD